jgi:predicted ABC-type ATPase
MTGELRETPPLVIALAGPNGAGKSTAATRAIPSSMPYVNADEIAKTLPSYPSRSVDLEAGRLALEELERLESNRASFAFETTLAGKTLAPRIRRLRPSGYVFRLVFVWAPSAEFCILRVASRVRAGGHDPILDRRR